MSSQRLHQVFSPHLFWYGHSHPSPTDYQCFYPYYSTPLVPSTHPLLYPGVPAVLSPLPSPSLPPLFDESPSEDNVWAAERSFRSPSAHHTAASIGRSRSGSVPQLLSRRESNEPSLDASAAVEDDVIGAILKRRGLDDAAKLLMSEMDMAKRLLPSAGSKRLREDDVTSCSPSNTATRHSQEVTNPPKVKRTKGLVTMASSLLLHMDKELNKAPQMVTPGALQAPEDRDCSRRRVLLHAAQTLLSEMEEQSQAAVPKTLPEKKGPPPVVSDISRRRKIGARGSQSTRSSKTKQRPHAPRASLSGYLTATRVPCSEKSKAPRREVVEGTEKRWPVIFGVELVPVSKSVQ